MSELKVKLQICLMRSNEAYKLYKDEKKYYQAKRIYKANQELYTCLLDYLYLSPRNKQETLSFLFHLEDWFEQLKEHKVKLGSDLNLNSEFVFSRLDNSPIFPINFFKNII